MHYIYTVFFFSGGRVRQGANVITILRRNIIQNASAVCNRLCDALSGSVLQLHLGLQYFHEDRLHCQ
jgi:hypothetical protein